MIFLITGGLLCLRASDAIHSGERRIGVNTADGAVAVKVTSAFPGMPADRAGLRTGDEILAVDGQPLHDQGDYQRAAGRLRRGRPTHYHVLRQGNTFDLIIVPGVSPSWTAFIIDAVTAFCFLLIAWLAMSQLPDLRARLLAAFSIAVAAELALPINSIGNLPMFFAARTAFYLLTGLQMGLEASTSRR